MQSSTITLVILAAGLSKRYGRLKQIEQLGPNGETIIDYSVYDAIQAGFTKIVFVIRKEIEEVMKATYTHRYENEIEIIFVNQDITDVPSNQIYNIERTKPWGTAHALWSARNVVNENFAVINADDFYGRESFFRLSNFLNQAKINQYCVIGFLLNRTLSDNGSVNRAVCQFDDQHYLSSIKECLNIQKTNEHHATCIQTSQQTLLNLDSLVSMNMFGFTPSFFKYFEYSFKSFLQQLHYQSEEECYIPLILDEVINKNKASIKVLRSYDQWLGITYAEDKSSVAAAIQKLHKRGLYPNHLSLLQNKLAI